MLRRQLDEMRCAAVNLHVCQSRKMNHMLDLFDEIRQVTIYTVWNKYIDYLDEIHPISAAYVLCNRYKST